MRRKCKSLIAMILTAAMMVGCGSKTGGISTGAEGKTINTNTGNFNEYGWEIPEETLTLKVLDASGYYAPSQAQKEGEKNGIEYVKEKFNVQFDIEHVSGDGKEALNLALASGDYPDIITNVPFDLVAKFVKMGKAKDLTPYMDTIGSEVKKSMGEHYPLFLDDSGKLYYVPTLMGAIAELPDKAVHIRYDEWKAIGSPEIKTPEDYYNAINAILEKFPTTPSGEKRYALSFYADPGHWSDPESFSGFWGLKSGYKVDESGDFQYWAFTEEGKEMTKFFNRFYLDKTLDPDSFVNNYEQWQTKFSNERIVGAIGEWWITYQSGHEIWQSLDPNTPEDKRYIQVGFKADGVDTASVSGKNYLGNSCTIITDKASDPEAIMKFINFQAKDLGKALFGWGIPNGTPVGDTGRTGKFWDIDENGSWQVDPEAKKQMLNETWSYDDEYYWNVMPWLFMNQSRWEDGEHNIWPNQMWYEENKWKSIMINNLEDTIYDSSAYTLRVKTDEVKIAEQAVRDAWKMNWGAAVQANNDAEFEAAWKKLQDALTTAGIEKLEAARAENYKKNMEKLKN